LKLGKPDLVSGDLSAEAAIAATRRAKIICTIGPSCNTEARLREMMQLGMDVARLNFSHGTHPEHARNIALPAARGEAGEPHDLLSCRICKVPRSALDGSKTASLY
jgi:hypothetical protein